MDTPLGGPRAERPPPDGGLPDVCAPDGRAPGLSADAAPAADSLCIGGLQPFSSADWPGRLVAVVFVQGCPWRCGYCHNPGLQPRQATPGSPVWADVVHLLQRRCGLLDGVVFSGGEPLLDPALPAAVQAARALGFAVGLHTAGIYPQRLAALLPQLDWVALDLKHDTTGYDGLTGRRGSAAAVARSLAAVAARAAQGLPCEVRSTGDATLLPPDTLDRMARQLHQLGLPQWTLQRCRGTALRPADPRPWPDAQALARCRDLGLQVALR